MQTTNTVSGTRQTTYNNNIYAHGDHLAGVPEDDHEGRRETEGHRLEDRLRRGQLHHEHDLNAEEGHGEEPVHVTVSIIERQGAGGHDGACLACIGGHEGLALGGGEVAVRRDPVLLKIRQY